MPIGVIVNCLAVLFGGIIGGILKEKIPKRLRVGLPMTFGVASMSMGIIYTIKLETLPAVILALILGSAVGELIYLEDKIKILTEVVNKKFFSGKEKMSKNEESEFLERFVGVAVLFCASGTGIFGALAEGINGDHSVLLTKSILDLFTAATFATALGVMVALIFLPQFIIFIILFFASHLIMPLVSPIMMADFTACGGMIMLATGFRISEIKAFPIANMLPSLLLVMPISYLWTTFIH